MGHFGGHTLKDPNKGISQMAYHEALCKRKGHQQSPHVSHFPGNLVLDKKMHLE
jgi:hypothetical protein